MTPEATVNEFIRRVVANDLESALEMVTDDIEYDNVPIGKNIGPDAMRAFLGVMAGNVDEVQFVIHRQTVTGNVVMNERTDRFRVGDAWMDLKVAGIFEVNDAGQVTLWRDYFDMGEFNEQMQKLAG
ncbi:MAG TPA: limonene-1,2-epoxide hydrolase family protein [Microthrixaceae bacterium]|jgi:limonene-1,2-epoxide hydrolase|nr:limonene-1,2-epoxide hydrolase family protein [Microthrixaceae bacterium]HQF96644.1 limonene-1,2-epoxide hydrolase family protein [Microthrixaceae bacterium]